MKNCLRRILQSPVYDVAIKTALEKASKLSAQLNNTVLLKREDTQPIFSFKCRGAYSCIHALSDTQKSRGVIASSAGNHAQGVALAARRLGISAKIVMPETTPSLKVESVRTLGAEVVLHGDGYDEAFALAQSLIAEEERVFISPFDDENIICGQGTVALEIVQQSAGALPDMIFVPVGGGGLISGIVAFLNEVAPEVKVIGVEPEDSACLTAALQAGRRVLLKQVGLFTDGVAVKQIGEHPWKLLRHGVDETITVSIDEICAAIQDGFESTRTIIEPAGALALAGLKKKVIRDQIKNKTLVAIQSGANMNFSSLQHVVERAEVGRHQEMLMAVTIPEKPGSFFRFCEILGKVSISEFNYRYSDKDQAHVFAGLKLRHMGQKQQIETRLRKHGYELVDLSDDELSKNHIRHMVGGRVKGLENERIYRFIFPERPHALMEFLKMVSHRWNISLFHYRNHGAAYGRVLAGFQLPVSEKKEFEELMRTWDQAMVEETSQPSYRMFLS